ncbi:hypothetical protein GCM10022267_31480 [Lentzea roselyniae]|uniref:Leucine-binding protein domain-containing protein n=1 Tax=Lentzea roselyniae TaxID=531940 RepID=A0ABP7AX37_9PSEU
MVETRLSRRAVLGGAFAAAASPLVLQTSVAAQDQPPLRVGVLVDTSGPASIHGARQLLGVEHQAELIGRGVRLDVRDAQGDVANTRKAVAALIEDRVDALIGTSMPPTAAVVMEAAQATGVPLVVPTSPPPLPPFVFTSSPTSPQSRGGIMDALAAASVRRVGLLILDTLATDKALKVYEEQAAIRGLELAAVVKHTMTDTSLTQPMTALVNEKPDGIILATPPPFSALGVRAAHELKWDGVLCCGPPAGHPGFLERAGEAAEGVRVVAPWFVLGDRIPDNLPNSWAVRAFVESFTAKHGPVGTYVGFGADALAMLHHAYTGHRDRERARTTLEHMTFVGLTGVFRMTPDNHAGIDDAALTTLIVRKRQWAIL